MRLGAYFNDKRRLSSGPACSTPCALLAAGRRRAAEAAADLVAKWDANALDLDEDGKYDSPGQTIFEAWFRQMLADTFSEEKVGPVSQVHCSSRAGTCCSRCWTGPRGPLPLKLRLPGRPTPRRGDGARAARRPSTRCARTTGRTSAKWLSPGHHARASSRRTISACRRRRATTAARRACSRTRRPGGCSVPQGFEKRMTFPQMRRGTTNHFVVLSDKGVIGVNVVAPGQSGIPPDAGHAEPPLHGPDRPAARLRVQADAPVGNGRPGEHEVRRAAFLLATRKALTEGIRGRTASGRTSRSGTPPCGRGSRGRSGSSFRRRSR